MSFGDEIPSDVILRDLNGRVLSEAELNKLVMVVRTADEKKSTPYEGQKCLACDRLILIMSFKGTGICSELCRKVTTGRITLAKAEELRQKTLPKEK